MTIVNESDFEAVPKNSEDLESINDTEINNPEIEKQLALKKLLGNTSEKVIGVSDADQAEYDFGKFIKIGIAFLAVFIGFAYFLSVFFNH